MVLLLPRDVEVAALPGPDRDRNGDARPDSGGDATRPVLVRFDVPPRARDDSPGITAHLAGIGLAGIVWAIRAAVHAAREPAERVVYGDDPDQVIELRRPRARGAPAAGDAAPAGIAPTPVVVLVHGGYWRSRWQRDLMDALAIDLTARGVISGNLGYRRPDRHGWPATLADVHAGVQQARAQAADDPGAAVPVVLMGHSAGGQLVLQVAEERAAAGDAPTAVVSLAGIADLHAAADRELSDGAVRLALGGGPDEVPERYAAASALARPVRAVPTTVIQGTDDDPDLLEMNRRFVAATAAAGTPVRSLEHPGDHFAVIDPREELGSLAVRVALEAVGLDPDPT